MHREEQNKVRRVLESVLRSAADFGLGDFLLIGGNAVIAHGVPRFTRDVDFVIPDREESAWRNMLENTGFEMFHGTHAFLQFREKNPPQIRVDLMLVDESTWQKLEADAWRLELGDDNENRVVSPQHLIAMKLKACRSSNRREDAVDWRDIVELTMVHGFRPESEGQYADFVIRFGGEELHRKLVDEIKARRIDL